MIPVSVSLLNFLTYSTSSDGGPVVFDFEGARIWSISGDNGSGKTSLFDAITYVLFGEHRGGSQHDRRLVRQGADTMEVALVFRHDGQLWRIRRTLHLSQKRNGTTQERKAAEVTEWDEAEASWVPVPGADSVSEVKAWVTSTLRLRSDVFRSTVLLEQGGADRILTVEPALRFEIFAGLVDLDVYRRLEEAAASRRRDAQATAKSIKVQLEALDEVSASDFAAASADLKATSAQLDAANTNATDTATALAGAHRFTDLKSESESLEATLQRLQRLLADADQIRSDATRAEQLSRIIPAIEEADRDLCKAAAAQVAAANCRDQINNIDPDALAKDLEEAAREVEAAQGKVEALKATDKEFRTWHPKLKRRRAARVAVARQREAASAAGDPAEIAAEINELLKRQDTTRDQIRDLEAQLDALRDKVASHQARSEHLTSQVAERRNAAQEATCSRCGQPVDAEHLASEIAELTNAESEAHAKATETISQRDTVAAALDDALELERHLVNEIAGTERRADRANNAASDLAAAARELDACVADELSGAWAAADGGDDCSTAEALALDERARNLPDQLSDAHTGTTAAQDHQADVQKLLHEAKMKAVRLAGEADRYDEEAKGAQAAAAARLCSLDDSVRAKFSDRRADLVAELRAEARTVQGAPDQLEALDEAERDQHVALNRIAAVAEERESIPPEHRLDLDVAKTALDEARAAVVAAADARDSSRDTLRRLQENEERGSELVASHAEAVRCGALAGRLEGLLGRSGLQGALLGQAIGVVEDLANETLGRLSRGALAVSLRVDDTSKSRKLEIQVTDVASADEPLEVAFVSGSQRFRVAVALAAGLGQYVGGPDAVRALIIDEGFGSLDEAGRGEMIAELTNLANHLERVIVVSHHTDFSDPTRFPQSFHLRKVDRHTELSRII